MSGQGKIKLREGTPEEIAAYKQAFNMVHSPDWVKNSTPMDATEDDMAIGSPPPSGYWIVNWTFGIIVGFGFIALLEIGYRLIWGAT